VNDRTGETIKVDVFAPDRDEEDAMDLRPACLETAKDCWRLISKNGTAQAAMRNLQGCDWVQPLAFVDLYCRACGPEGVDFCKDNVKYQRKLARRISRFEATVTKWESAIRTFNADITELVHVELAPHAPRFDAYKQVLWIARTHALPSARKLRIAEECLVYLRHLLVLSTGRPHYREIGDLILARLACDNSLHKTKEFDAAMIRDHIEYFRKTEPDEYESLRKAAKSFLRQAPPEWRVLPVTA
jgi:hypothetical protein